MKRFLPPLLIALLAAALFAPIIGHDFTNLDDFQTIAFNPYLRPPTLDRLGHLWTAPAAGLYVPVTYSIWWLAAHVGFYGQVMHPWPFHLLSVALHGGNGILVWLILRRLRFSLWPALVGATLFVVHPVQVEPVAWASGAKDLLATCLSLGAIANYFKPLSPTPRTRGEGDLLFNSPDHSALAAESHSHQPIAWLSIAWMILAVLAKPSALMTPFIIAAIDWIYVHRTVRCVFRRLWPIGLVMLPLFCVARSVQAVWPAVATPLWQRPLIAGDALAFYIAKIVWPASLTHIYGRTPMQVASSSALFWSWLLPAAVCLIVLSQIRRRPGLAAGVAVFALALLPVLGLMPFEFQIHSTVADHYLDFALLGVSMIAADWVESLRVPYWIVSLALLALAVRAAVQIPVWKNSLTLDAHAVAVHPQSVDAHGALAIALAEAGQLQAAVPHLQFVVAHVPDNRMGHLRLAQVWLGLKQFDRALPEAVAAVRLTSIADRDPTPNLMLAEALIALDRRAEATAALETARRIDPANPTILEKIDALNEQTSPPSGGDGH